MEKPEPKSCGVLVFRRQPDRSFLLMEHADRLDLPKGHVDPGETDLECALRELDEETGITGQMLEIDPDFRFELKYVVMAKRFGPSPVEKTLIIFLGELVEPVDIQVTEHLGFHWHNWSPPHHIQTETIDPLLEQVAKHWGRS